MVVSVVIPCYKSGDLIAKVVSMTRDELVANGLDYEFVLVNDCSQDDTFREIAKLCEADPRVVGIDCAKNLGQQSAIMAGLRYVRGDYVMLMDDDMQTHPSQCMKLVNEIIFGDVDVVFAKWKTKREAGWRKMFSKFAAWLSRRLVARPEGVSWCNFCIMRRFVCDEVTRYEGPFISIMGLVNRATFNMTNVEVEHFERERGKSGYSFSKLLRLWAATLNFSIVPLRMASIVGMLLGFVGVVAAIVVVVQKLLNPEMSAGWPSIMAVMLICSGLIMISLGIVGEYIGRVFMTLNSAPQYIIKKVIDQRNVTCADTDASCLSVAPLEAVGYPGRLGPDESELGEDGVV